METAERRNYPYYIILGYTPPRGTLGILVVAPSDECLVTAPRLASTQALRSVACPRLRSFSARPDHVSAHRASGLGFVAQPTNRRFYGEPPQTQRADSGREPLPCTGSCPRLRLAFLATMRPAVDPAGHRVPQAEPTCLSTPRRPRKAKIFRARSSPTEESGGSDPCRGGKRPSAFATCGSSYHQVWRT
jgi:hypothetical protein